MWSLLVTTFRSQFLTSTSVIKPDEKHRTHTKDDERLRSFSKNCESQSSSTLVLRLCPIGVICAIKTQTFQLVCTKPGRTLEGCSDMPYCDQNCSGLSFVHVLRS